MTLSSLCSPLQPHCPKELPGDQVALSIHARRMGALAQALGPFEFASTLLRSDGPMELDSEALSIMSSIPTAVVRATVTRATL
jgi:hypothetical protein